MEEKPKRTRKKKYATEDERRAAAKASQQKATKKYLENLDEEGRAKVRARRSGYIQRNKEKIYDQIKAWRKANPEKVKQYSKSYYSKNKDKIAIYSRTWDRRNSEHRRTKERERWQTLKKSEPERYAAILAKRKKYQENYRARKRAEQPPKLKIVKVKPPKPAPAPKEKKYTKHELDLLKLIESYRDYKPKSTYIRDLAMGYY